MTRFRLILVILATLVLGGCGDPLVTSYGTIGTSSVNGLTVLQRSVENRTRMRRFHLLSPRLERDCQLLIHVARTPGVPDADACTWIREWLDGDEDRQVVLVLRDGNLAPWLCRIWAEQARREAQRGGKDAEMLATLAKRLEQRAADEKEPALPEASKPLTQDTKIAPTCTCGKHHQPADEPDDDRLLSITPAPSVHPTALSGLHLTAVPQALTAGSHVRLHAKTVTSLITLRLPGTTEPLVWAQSAAIGSGRLVVVSNATPLLDGALPDPAARALSAALLDNILAEYNGRPACAWVNTLAVRNDEPHAANPMTMLFTLPPISWCTWHTIAALLVALASGAWWLGRRETPRDRRPDRFIRHVDALARQLQDQRHADWCARTIARCHGLPPPPPLADADAARAWLIRATAEPIPHDPLNPDTKRSTP